MIHLLAKDESNITNLKIIIIIFIFYVGVWLT